MYKGFKIAAVIPCLNEEKKIGLVVTRVLQTGICDQILVVDDGSSDTSASVARRAGADVMELGKILGVGAALRAGFDYLKNKADILVVLAGNNKDEPKEIEKLLEPLIRGEAILVQGTRYQKGGLAGGHMPLYRKFATRLHPFLFSLFTQNKFTDTTNGFRAFKVSLLNEPTLKLHQAWLDGYELEPYLLYKTATLKIPYKEVPVTKIYPSKKIGYTKMRPVTDWWNILRPLFLLRLGFKS